MLYLFAALRNGRDTSGGVVVCASPTGRPDDATVLTQLGVHKTASQAMQAALKEAQRLTKSRDPRTGLLPGRKVPCYIVPAEALPTVSDDALRAAGWSEADLDAGADEAW